jgi:AcrR family transcriptional regulator
MTEITDRQKQIITEAIKIIASDGIQNLTIKNLSKAVGVTEAALYRHYENKHAILLSIVDLFEDFAKTDAKGKGLDGIRSFVMERYEKFARNPELSKVMFSESLFINDKELSERMRQIMHTHRKMLELMIDEAKRSKQIDRSADPKSLFRIIIGSLRLLVVQWCYNGYDFDLVAEGQILWNNVELLIIKGDAK